MRVHFLKIFNTGIVKILTSPSFLYNLFVLHVPGMQFVSCTWIAIGLLILNKTLWEKPVTLWILYFVPPIAVSRRPVLPTKSLLPTQIQFFLRISYLVLTSTLPLPSAPEPSPLAGKKEAASIIPGSSVCTMHVLWQPVAAWWGASRSVRGLLTCDGEFMLRLLPSLRQHLGFPSLACSWVSTKFVKA